MHFNNYVIKYGIPNGISEDGHERKVFYMGPLRDEKVLYRLTGTSEKALAIATDVARRMSYREVDPAHVLVAVSSLGVSDAKMPTPRILREIGLRHEEIFSFFNSYGGFRYDPLEEYPLNGASKEALHLADQVAHTRGFDTMINLNDFAAGIFMSDSELIEGLLLKLMIPRIDVLRRLQVDPWMLQRYRVAITV